MNTYESTKIIILNGGYNKEEILKKLDVFLNFDRVTIEQYNELMQLIKK